MIGNIEQGFKFEDALQLKEEQGRREREREEEWGQSPMVRSRYSHGIFFHLFLPLII